MWASALSNQRTGNVPFVGGQACVLAELGCTGYLCIVGGEIVTPRENRIAVCSECRRAWCFRCGDEVVCLGASGDCARRRYISTTCNNGIDVFMPLFPDGEWVHIPAEALRNGSVALTAAGIAQIAVAMLRNGKR